MKFSNLGFVFHIFVSICMLALVTNYAQARKCRALALSGGGSKGAYQAGVIQELVNLVGNAEENLAYDVITGVSAGSLNTLGLGGFEPHDVEESSAFIYALWNSIPDYNAYGNWDGGIAEGLFSKSGIFDLSPGVEWVSEKWEDRVVKRKVSFATVDANHAEYVTYDYEATGTLPDDYIESAFASSSIPAVFPHIQRGDKTLVDGGVIWNVDIPSAVRRCMDIVDKQSDIIVDFIMCGDHSLASQEELGKYSTLQNFMRGIEINSFYNGMSDYNSSINTFPEVEFRYAISPSENIDTGLVPLDFSRAQVDKCYEVGAKDARNAVKLGPGGYGKVMLEYYDKLQKGEPANLDSMIQDAISKQAKAETVSE